MSVSVIDEGDRVCFHSSNSARLYFCKPTDEMGLGTLSTEGSWYVNKNGIDELIAVLTSIRHMFDDKS